MPAAVKRLFLTGISLGETVKMTSKSRFTSAGSFLEVILTLSPVQEAF